MAFDPETLLIVGAGFSANAGLPVAKSFTQDLLNLNGLKLDGPSARQVDFIQKFVNQVFGEGASSSADEWPELEDVFTLVDLSANTGHHLGTKYSAAELRVVRRAIIVRMIRMLSQAYKRGQKQNGAGWTALERLFTKFNTAATAVLSMNWDTVFERGIARTQSIKRIDYGCHATALTFLRGQLATRSLRGN